MSDIFPNVARTFKRRKLSTIVSKLKMQLDAFKHNYKPFLQFAVFLARSYSFNLWTKALCLRLIFARKCFTGYIIFKLLLGTDNGLLGSEWNKELGGHGRRCTDEACGILVWIWKTGTRRSAWSPRFLA